MMTLWGALSGKVYRWNQMNEEAFGIYLANLCDSQQWHEQEFPAFMNRFLLTRDFEVAYYASAQRAFSAILNGEAKGLRKALNALNAKGLNAVIASLNFHYVFFKYGSVEQRGKYVHLYCVARDSFAMPHGFFEGWTDTFAWHDLLGHSPGLFMRYNQKLYGEIAPLLGLPTEGTDVVTGAIEWGGLSVEIANTAIEACEHPSWRQTVDEWIQGQR